MGATHVISVCLPMPGPSELPRHMLHVINRCFQILQRRTEQRWRAASDAVIMPQVSDTSWDGFEKGQYLIDQGEKAAMGIIPQVKQWLAGRTCPAASGF
jgi:hypothetical protein